MYQLTPFMLERLYGKIKDELIQTSTLENIDVSTGAVPYIMTKLYPTLNKYTQITIADRVAGVIPTSVTESEPSKYKKEVDLGKIQIGNKVYGVQLVRRFEDCKSCMEIQGCDRFDIGSMIFQNKMFTGYTDQDVAYNESTGLFSGNCRYNLLPHTPEDPRINVEGVFYAKLLPVQERIHNAPESWENFPHRVHAAFEREDMQRTVLFSDIGKITFAGTCAEMIMKAYSSL